MKFISFFGLLFFVILIGCKNNTNGILPGPLNKLELGMSKEDAEIEIKKLKLSKIINEHDFLTIEGLKTEVTFHFCNNVFGETLEGVVFRTLETDKLYDNLDKKINQNTNIKLEKLFIKNSCFSSDSETMICLYTNKMKYNGFYLNLICN